ncbi:MAG: hypothetical protein ACYTFY_04345 [Planctomycetota bacterium]|jgi:hypothetical protein
MESLKGKIVVVIVILISAVGIYFMQNKLDGLHPKRGFEEFMYIPNGTALKIATFGFDSPVSDVLYLKSLIYWSQNINAISKNNKEARFKFLFKAINACTDLNPQFATAYLNGGLLISASNKPAEAKIIFEKGVKARPLDWHLHMNLAVLSLINFADMEAAVKHYKLASKCPGVSSAVIGAWQNLALEHKGVNEKTDPVHETSMRIALWEDTLKEKDNSEELDTFGRSEIAELKTKRLVILLDRAYLSFIKNEKSRPDLSLLSARNYVKGKTAQYLSSFPYIDGDAVVFSVTGKATSLRVMDKRVLVAKISFQRDKENKKKENFYKVMRTHRLMLNITKAIKTFYLANNRYPAFEEIVNKAYLSPFLVSELQSFPFLENDEPVITPAGAAVSKRLLEIDISGIKAKFKKAVEVYKERKKLQPEGFKDLIAENLLNCELWHPLFDMGYRMNFNFSTGDAEEHNIQPLRAN